MALFAFQVTIKPTLRAKNAAIIFIPLPNYCL